MKRSIIIFILLGSFIGGIFWYGSNIPERSHTHVSQQFMRSGEDISALLSDYLLYPKWRENVYAVKKIPSKNRHHAWTETDENGKTLSFQILEFKQDGPVTEIILDVTGKKQLSQGQLHFKIVSSEDNLSSQLTISEDKLIPSMVFRVLTHLLTQGTQNIDAYFRSINNKFTGDVQRKQPRVVRRAQAQKPSVIDTPSTAPEDNTGNSGQK
ncbi:hypothetical protein MNBD_GAMMA10-2800 [hydrothermal vent metagenome]|uniref:Coenzyme Q-binding protein COQ10 START domain-containing protein n=1 Tax=hydrothermal vent metagenome TaxID=652676 RepID=A0A3B0XJJ3_9ZZZZ